MVRERIARDLSETFSLHPRSGWGDARRAHRDKTDKTPKLYPLAVRPLPAAADLSEAYHLAVLRADR
jgi:hypothetical protein